MRKWKGEGGGQKKKEERKRRKKNAENITTVHLYWDRSLHIVRQFELAQDYYFSLCNFADFRLRLLYNVAYIRKSFRDFARRCNNGKQPMLPAFPLGSFRNNPAPLSIDASCRIFRSSCRTFFQTNRQSLFSLFETSFETPTRRYQRTTNPLRRRRSRVKILKKTTLLGKSVEVPGPRTSNC